MLIGIVGKARSGKDTFAKMLAQALREKQGITYILMAYATELKERVQKDFDLSYDQLWGDEKEAEDKRYSKPIRTRPFCMGLGKDKLPYREYWTPREIMQAYGEFYRSVDYDFWVKSLFNSMEEKEYHNVIVTDVRHPNEADPIKEAGGFVVKVQRDKAPKIHGAEHISETAMDDYENFDSIIVNDYGLKELKEAARDAANFLITMYKEAKNG